MLSAVAARRAAMAQAVAAEQEKVEIGSSNSFSSEEEPSGPATPSKKRKIAANSPRNNNKKKRVESHSNKTPLSLGQNSIAARSEKQSTKQHTAVISSLVEEPALPLTVESDSEDDAPLEARRELTPPPIRPPVTTFVASPQTIYHPTTQDLNQLDLSTPTTPAQSVILALSPSTSLSLLGTFSLTVLRGCVSLFGTTLQPSRISRPVFAPRSYPVATIRSEPIPQSSMHLWPGSTQLFSIPLRVKQDCGEDDAIILISELKRGIEGMGDICKIFDGIFEPADDAADGDGDSLGLEGVSLIRYPLHGQSEFMLLPSWERALDSIPLAPDESHIDTSNVFLVKGPKRSGKSTFARTLLNRLTTRYQRVAYLECDIGQSEFTPAGMVSLHVVDQPVFGPPFTHPRQPYRAHFIGGSTPRSTPSHYLACITALVQAYRLELRYSEPPSSPLDEDDLELQDISDGSVHGRSSDPRAKSLVPLVVNTHGWTKGLGADLMQKIEGVVEPSHIFEFEDPGNAFTPPWMTMARPGPKSRITTTADDNHHILERIPNSAHPNHFSAADQRTLSILSYFHSRANDDGDIHWNTDLPLCATPPYEVTPHLALDRIVLLGAGAEDVVPGELARAINAGIVALVAPLGGESVVPSADEDDRERANGLPYSQGSLPPSPTSSHCLGLGLIRSIINPTATSPIKLHLLTPIASSLLSSVRILVKGELELPVWGMLDHRDPPPIGSRPGTKPGQVQVQGEEDDQVDGICGVEWNLVPYLQWTTKHKERSTTQVHGAAKRRVRRNLMRKAQM